MISLLSNFGVFSQKLCWLNKFTSYTSALLPLLRRIICMLLRSHQRPHSLVVWPIQAALHIDRQYAEYCQHLHKSGNSIFHYILFTVATHPNWQLYLIQKEDEWNALKLLPRESLYGACRILPHLSIIISCGYNGSFKTIPPTKEAFNPISSHLLNIVVPISNHLDQGISCRRVVVLMVLLILRNLGVKVPLQPSSTRDTKFYDSIKAMKRE